MTDSPPKYFETNAYQVKKWKDGKPKYLGCYPTFNEAFRVASQWPQTEAEAV